MTLSLNPLTRGLTALGGVAVDLRSLGFGEDLSFCRKTGFRGFPIEIPRQELSYYISIVRCKTVTRCNGWCVYIRYESGNNVKWDHRSNRTYKSVYFYTPQTIE